MERGASYLGNYFSLVMYLETNKMQYISDITAVKKCCVYEMRNSTEPCLVSLKINACYCKISQLCHVVSLRHRDAEACEARRREVWVCGSCLIGSYFLFSNRLIVQFSPC